MLTVLFLFAHLGIVLLLGAVVGAVGGWLGHREYVRLAYRMTKRGKRIMRGGLR